MFVSHGLLIRDNIFSMIMKRLKNVPKNIAAEAEFYFPYLV